MHEYNNLSISNVKLLQKLKNSDVKCSTYNVAQTVFTTAHVTYDVPNISTTAHLTNTAPVAWNITNHIFCNVMKSCKIKHNEILVKKTNFFA